MSIGHIVSWLLCGLIVGLLARFIVPGRQSMSLATTTLLGVTGALLGGFLYSLIRGAAVEPFSFSERVWYGWIVATFGAVLVVWVYPQMRTRSWHG
jgi:uncharacterized membrane protein YeaQ/YmgE (transglycosylase-associated protein family)